MQKHNAQVCMQAKYEYHSVQCSALSSYRVFQPGIDLDRLQAVELDAAPRAKLG